MIGFLIPFAVKMVGPRFAKPLIYAVLIVLAIGAFFAAKALYDRSIIREHDARQEVEAIKRTAERERAATTADEVQRRRDEAEATELQKEVDNAVNKHPEEARRSSGPASDAALRKLRERQQAKSR